MTTKDLDESARRELTAAILGALKSGEPWSPGLLAEIRRQQETIVAEAQPGSREALLAQRVIAMAEYVRDGSPLPLPEEG